MYPIHRYMDSYPQTCHPHRDQASYPYTHVYPSWESPLNGTSRYFSPGDCNGCWNHAYPPAPFVHCPHPQLVQRHFHGDYPPCPNIYPAYFIPPSQYVVDQGRSHCCGCPNHSCQKKDDCGWKIEQENAGIESKNSSSSDMIRRLAYPYPLVWFPPYHMKDFDGKTPNLKDNGSSSTIQWPMYPYPAFWLPPDHMKDNNRQASEPQEHAPLDRWIPLDKNSLKSLRENEDEKIQNQQNGPKRVQLPPPIIWMPSYDQSQESEKSVRDANASPRGVEDLPPKFKIIPVNLLENENRNEKPGEEDANPGSQICSTLPEKGRGPKNIPVKHVEENGLKKLDHPEKQGGNGAEKLSAHEKQKEENQEKRISDCGTKKQTSPGRSSKLPPVCLRVDPLPRKKMGNGSLRSPSPPGKKEVKDNQEIKESKAGGSGGLEESKKDATMDKEIRVVGVEDRANGKPQEDDTKDVNRIVEIEDRSTSEKEGEEKNEDKLDVDSTENQAGMGIEVLNGTGKFGSMAKKVENGKCGQLMGNDEVSLGHFENKFDECKKNIEESVVNKMKENAGRKFKLSEIDAVLHIQAACRGYEVRRWEPLKKLKQIARIREQVSSIKQQIHSLEVSSEGGQLDEKQRLFMSETIMSLLLQLDTIQIQHPGDLRKHVTASLSQHRKSTDRNAHTIQPVSPASYSSSMEVAACNQAITPTTSLDIKGRTGYSLKTSMELLRVLNRIWSLEEQHASSMSLAKSLKLELEHAQQCVQELLRERQSDRHEIDVLTKQIMEDKPVRKRKEQERIKAAIQSVRDELEDERRLRSLSENLHRKLAKELSEVKSAFLKTLKDLEREKKAHTLLEDLCDEFAKGVREYELEVRELKQKSEKGRSCRCDRLVLHISETWLDERLQMKLAESQGDLSEKNTIIDRLTSEIEAFLQARRINRSTDDVLVQDTMKDNGLRRRSLESIRLNGAISAPQDAEGEDSVASDSHCFELNMNANATERHESVKWSGRGSVESTEARKSNSTEKMMGSSERFKYQSSSSSQFRLEGHAESCIGAEAQFMNKVQRIHCHNTCEGGEYANHVDAVVSEKSEDDESLEDVHGIKIKEDSTHGSNNIMENSLSEKEFGQVNNAYPKNNQKGDSCDAFSWQHNSLTVGRKSASGDCHSLTSPVRRWRSHHASPDLEISESSSKTQGVKESSLKAKLLEARLEGQHARLKTFRASSVGA